MIKLFFILYGISLYLSIPGFLSKAGYSAITGLIPVYNIYLLFQLLEINPILILLLGLGLVFLPFRGVIATIIFIFFPFLVCNAYSKGLVYSFFCLILPFILFPTTAYYLGTYRYDLEV